MIHCLHEKAATKEPSGISSSYPPRSLEISNVAPSSTSAMIESQVDVDSCRSSTAPESKRKRSKDLRTVGMISTLVASWVLVLFYLTTVCGVNLIWDWHHHPNPWVWKSNCLPMLVYQQHPPHGELCSAWYAIFLSLSSSEFVFIIVHCYPWWKNSS